MNAPGPCATAAVVLQVRDVVKTFDGKTALDHVSLDLRSGECLGLLGPNGAGKTTLVRSIVGRVRLDSGTISVNGFALGTPQASAQLAWVPQELAIYPTLSARENLQSFAAYSGLRGALMHEAVDWCLAWAALRDRANEPCSGFSGGMKRRLNMAAGLITRAPIALLDEPTVGIDPQSRERIYEMITELRATGTSVVYTSHYMEEVERLCDRIVIIDQGRIIAQGTAAELIAHTFGTAREIVMQSDSTAATAWAQQNGATVAPDGLHFPARNATSELAALLSGAEAAGVTISNLFVRTPTLQDVFLKLTGKELRE